MRPQLKHTVRLLLRALCCAAILFPIALHAQFNTPAQDGNIGAGEYGIHVDGQNQQFEGSTTWYMTWDNNNLYIALTGSNVFEAAVIYLDVNPIVPVNGGSDADGSINGFNNYDRNHALQPFRADFVLYMKDGYHEYRHADGNGNWTGQTSNTLPVFSTAANVIEIAVPWNAITQGSGRPPAFNWYGFKVYNYGPSLNGVYHSVPVGNPNCGCNQDPSQSYITRYYNVLNTGNGSSTRPFSTVSFTYHQDFSGPGIGGYYLNGGSFYDLTVNDNSTDNADNNPGNFFYDNNEISNRVLVDGAINVSHDIYVEQGSALLPADNLGPAVLVTIRMNGGAGSIYNFGRIDANPEINGLNDWNNRRIDFIFDGTTTIQPSPLFKDRFRLANVTVNNGASLLGPATGSAQLELQYGTLNNNGTIDAGDGSAGILDLSTRGDVPQQNDYFLNSSGGTGVWRLHDFLIGRNSSTLRPFNAGSAIRFELRGDFENYGHFMGIDGTGRIDVVMNGRFRQEIVGNTIETVGATTSFHNLEIANATGLGDYNNSGDVHFRSDGGGTIDYFITGELRLTGGDLVTRDRTNPAIVHRLQLNEGASVVFPGAVSNLSPAGSCFIDGPLSREVSTAAPTFREFPVGKSMLVGGYLIGDYRYLALELDHDLASSTIYTAEMFLDDRSTFYAWPAPSPEVIAWISQQRYWNVSKSPGANVQTARITLAYDVSERNDGVINPGGLRIVKDDGAGNWVNIAVGGGGTGIGTGTITSNTFSNFSDFTLASIDGVQPLPVELLEFEAIWEDGAVRLDWRTAQEVNSDHFIVERSRDQVEFTAIGRVEAAGQSSLMQNYRSWDTHLEPGVDRYYYRLRMVDRDGAFRHSEVRTVLLSGEPEISIYPNPATEWVEVRANGVTIEEWKLVNALGQTVMEQKEGDTIFRISVSDLAQGAYLLLLKTPEGVLARRLTVGRNF